MAKKKSKLVLMIAVVVVLALGAGAYFMFLKPSGEEDPAAAEDTHATEEVELGPVMTVDSISVNLADGHYLRVGMGLQLTLDAGAHGEPSPAIATNAAIDLFSGRSIEEVSDPAVREHLRTELTHKLTELYHGGVVDVYLTEYVTQ